MLRMRVMFVAALMAFASTLQAQWTSSRPDGHAPLGVMADHRHEAGEIMFSYRFMYMSMNGSRVGTNEVTDQAVIDPNDGGFMVTPTKMPMIMHMFGFMYAPADVVTLMIMVPVVDISMDHITRMGGTRENPAFVTESFALGDIGLGALIGVADFGNQSVHLNAGLRVPTGSIDRMDVLPTSMGNEARLPYPMQTGSGTVDPQPGITYLGQAGDWSWGGQGRATIRLGTNDNDYTLGNKYLGTFWGGRQLNRNFSVSARLEAQRVENIDGMDPAPRSILRWSPQPGRISARAPGSMAAWGSMRTFATVP